MTELNKDNAELILYYSPLCFYCTKVLKVLKKFSRDVVLKNLLLNSDHRKELLAIGGKTQVPCLVINEKPLYESDDIIEWLQKNG